MPARPRPPVIVAIAYATVCVVWGSTYLFIKLGVEVMPPYLLGGVRFSLAGLVLVAACALAGRPFPRDRRALANLALVSALFLVIGNGLLNVSEKTLDSGLAALFVVTTPIWLALLAMGGRHGERLSPLGWAGLAISIGGVALLVRPFESGAPTSWLGIAAVLTAAFCWAVGGILSKRRLRGVDPFVASALEALFAGPCMLAIHLLLERGEPVVWNGQAWLAVGYLAGMGSIVGFTAFVYLTTHMTSSRVGTYTYVNPIVALLLGWLVLDEQITWRLAAGGGTILGGLLLLYFARVREGGRVVAPRSAGPIDL